MSKRKQSSSSSTNAAIKYCEVEPKECDGNCCYAKGRNKKGPR